MIEVSREVNQPQLIFTIIPKIMGDIGAISKTRTNSQQGYAFRGIDDMYNAIQPALVKHGVFCVPEVISREREERATQKGGVLFYTTLTVRHSFFASDGSSITVTTIGEAMDSGDKSTNKAMSAAMKYAFIELFCIQTDDDKDTENQTHEPTAKANKSKSPLITAEEAQILSVMCDEVGMPKDKFCKVSGIKAIPELAAARFEGAKAYLSKCKKEVEAA